MWERALSPLARTRRRLPGGMRVYLILPYIWSSANSVIGLAVCLQLQTHSGASFPASWTSFVKLWKVCIGLMGERFWAWFWISYSLKSCPLSSITSGLHSCFSVREFGASLGSLWRVGRHCEFFTCLMWEWLHPRALSLQKFPCLRWQCALRPVFP